MGVTRAGMRAGTTLGGAQLGFAESPYGAAVDRSISFVATTSSIFVQLYTSAGVDCEAKFDDIVLEEAGSYLITGSPVALSKTGRMLTATGGSYAIAGTAATLRVSRRLSAEEGTYIQGRAPASLYVGRRISADAGSYALTPSVADLTYIQGFFLRATRGALATAWSDVSLLVGRRVVADPAALTITGAAVSWIYRRVILAAPAVYAIAGVAATFRIGHRLAAVPGSFVLQGTDINLINRRLIASGGAYEIDTLEVGLTVGKRISAAPGVYNVAGSSASLLNGRRLAAAPGSYAVTGADATARLGRSLSALGGAYALAGTAARLAKGYTVHANPGAYVLSGAAMSPRILRKLVAGSRAFHLSWPDVTLTPTWRPRGPRAIGVGFAASRYLSVPPQSRRIAVEPQSRRIAVEPAAQRYAAVEPRDKEPEGGSMLQWPEKDPNEVLDYELDWAKTDAPRLEASETLLTSVWSIVEGDVVIDTGLTTFTAQGLSTLWLSGGTPATKCILLNRVTTSKGRTYDKSVVLRVRNH